MKLIKALCVIVVLAGIVAAVMSVRPAYGQAPRDRERMPQLMMLEGAGSQIGVTARDLDPADTERLKVTDGVYVDDVRPDSPAARAGLRASDVVVEFDGERVRSVRQFTRLVRETPPERSVKTTVWRDGRRTELTVTPMAGGSDFDFNTERLRDRFEDLTARIRPFDFEFEMRDATPRARLGVTVQELTPDLAQYFGAKDGVLVSSVAAGSAGARAGLRAGDVITAVNGRSITSNGELVRELRGVSGGGDVTLGVVRDKKDSTMTAKIDVQPERRAKPDRPLRQARPIRTPA
jgi:serine protease Do